MSDLRTGIIGYANSVPVPSERGAWPQFYSSLATALRRRGPPPVDPFDAVATLRVLEDVRRSANDRAVISSRIDPASSVG